MDAMIFAAGLGTRLRPLTNDRPKALVEVAGMTMLERVARRLIGAGADRIIINTHPFPQQIEDLVRSRDDFGVEVLFSHEREHPLDTGGGLRRAASLFRGDAPFFIHNCDVVSNFDLQALYRTHVESDVALATLAVLPPSHERYLIFDEDGLCGYSPRGGGEEVVVRDRSVGLRRYDFTGIQVASPTLLHTFPDEPVFSIIMHYLALARTGHRVGRYEQPDARWIDIGTHDRLREAAAFVGGA